MSICTRSRNASTIGRTTFIERLCARTVKVYPRKGNVTRCHIMSLWHSFTRYTVYMLTNGVIISRSSGSPHPKGLTIFWLERPSQLSGHRPRKWQNFLGEVSRKIFSHPTCRIAVEDLWLTYWLRSIN